MPAGYKITQDEAAKRFEQCKLNLIGQYVNTTTKVECQCLCGKIFFCIPKSVFSKKTKLCGHCKDPNVGDMFGRLTIVQIIKGSYRKRQIRCLCDCGNKWNGNINHLRKIKSCGHCNDPHIGDRFKKLIVTKVIPSNYGGCTIVAKCDCGHSWSGDGHCLTSGNTQSCGNCQLRRNGVRTSWKQLELDDLIQSLGYDTIHNDIIWQNPLNKSNRIIADVSMPNESIVIEYDEYSWHAHRLTEDKLRSRKVRRLGWKTIRIKASKNLPTLGQLIKAFDELKKGAKARTITLSGWGVGKTRFPINNQTI